MSGPAALVLATLALLVLLEAAARYKTGRGYSVKASAATFGVALGGRVTRIAGSGVMAGVFLWVWSLAPVRWPMGDWRTWAVGFVLVEFAYYWFHRWSHTVRWLWATHNVHHSPRELTLPAAVRLGWTNLISGGWLVYTPLILAGFHPLVVAGLLALNLRYQFFLHTELVGRLGPLEWIFNTPSHHRVHHACNDAYLDKNFGGVLIVFDRMFGTFAQERRDEPCRYGLTQPLESHNPFVIALREWVWMARDLLRARSVKAAIRAAFGRPSAMQDHRPSPATLGRRKLARQP